VSSRLTGEAPHLTISTPAARVRRPGGRAPATHRPNCAGRSSDSARPGPDQPAAGRTDHRPRALSSSMTQTAWSPSALAPPAYRDPPVTASHGDQALVSPSCVATVTFTVRPPGRLRFAHRAGMLSVASAPRKPALSLERRAPGPPSPREGEGCRCARWPDVRETVHAPPGRPKLVRHRGAVAAAEHHLPALRLDGESAASPPRHRSPDVDGPASDSIDNSSDLMSRG
jgi:hypothetical protein